MENDEPIESFLCEIIAKSCKIKLGGCVILVSNETISLSMLHHLKPKTKAQYNDTIFSKDLYRIFMKFISFNFTSVCNENHRFEMAFLWIHSE